MTQNDAIISILVIKKMNLSDVNLICSCPAVQAASSTSQESGPTTLCILFTKVISDGILILPHHPNKKLFLYSFLHVVCRQK